MNRSEILTAPIQPSLTAIKADMRLIAQGLLNLTLGGRVGVSGGEGWVTYVDLGYVNGPPVSQNRNSPLKCFRLKTLRSRRKFYYSRRL